MAVATQRTAKTFNEIHIYCSIELNVTFNEVLTIPFILGAGASDPWRREKLGMTSRDPHAAFIFCRRESYRFYSRLLKRIHYSLTILGRSLIGVFHLFAYCLSADK